MMRAEIALRLRVGPTRAKYYMGLATWPKPVDEVSAGKIWWTEDVERWIAEHRPDLNEDAE